MVDHVEEARRARGQRHALDRTLQCTPCTPPLQVKHTIDYIFHDAGLRATRILAPPQEAELEPARLPGLRYPSDHLSLVAELEILS